MTWLGAGIALAIAAWVVAPLLRARGAAVCPNCGPRPEADARYCSSCGTPLGGATRGAS